MSDSEKIDDDPEKDPGKTRNEVSEKEATNQDYPTVVQMESAGEPIESNNQQIVNDSNKDQTIESNDQQIVNNSNKDQTIESNDQQIVNNSNKDQTIESNDNQIVNDLNKDQSAVSDNSNVKDSGDSILKVDEDAVSSKPKDNIIVNINERITKSESEITQVEEDPYEVVHKMEEVVIVFPSQNHVSAPRRARHRRVVRSRSWSARTRHDSLNTADIRLLRERLLRTQTHLQPGAVRGFTYQQKMTLFSLCIVDFMSFCSMSIMAPFFPREANEKGMTDSVSGFVFSFFALVIFITSPFFGKILPNVGAKFMLLTGMFVGGFCNILFGVLEYIVDYETFTAYCFVLRGFEALGASAYSTASFVYVVNTFPNNIGTVLGILETFIGLGMSVGPAIGGLLYSIGGFGLPFYSLGVAMILTMLINCFLLPVQNDYHSSQKSGSIMEIIKVPAVVITSIIIIVVSNNWAFLDPTLEPHLRQFDLDAHQVGLIFLLFSGLYGISSPLWGWLADRINNHWCMMVWGLVFCSIGLLLLGPSPLLPFLKSSLWLNLVGLSIVGISVALTLLPTFQGVLSSSIEEAGCSENIATYSVVAGVWSCMYSLGEVIGPSLGGVLLRNYGFAVCSTVMAVLTFTMAIVALAFFSYRENKQSESTESSSSNSAADKTWQTVSHGCDSPGPSNENDEEVTDDTQPLLFEANTSRNMTKQRQSYGGTGISTRDKNDSNHKIRNDTDLSSKNDDRVLDENHNHTSAHLKSIIQSKYYQKYLDESLAAIAHVENNWKTKRKGSDESDGGFANTTEENMEVVTLADEFISYNQNKVKYYKHTRRLDREGLLLHDGDEVTDVRGTVNISASGACEV